MAYIRSHDTDCFAAHMLSGELMTDPTAPESWQLAGIKGSMDFSTWRSCCIRGPGTTWSVRRKGSFHSHGPCLDAGENRLQEVHRDYESPLDPELVGFDISLGAYTISSLIPKTVHSSSPSDIRSCFKALCGSHPSNATASMHRVYFHGRDATQLASTTAKLWYVNGSMVTLSSGGRRRRWKSS